VSLGLASVNLLRKIALANRRLTVNMTIAEPEEKNITELSRIARSLLVRLRRAVCEVSASCLDFNHKHVKTVRQNLSMVFETTVSA